jgi:hypothetical protein
MLQYNHSVSRFRAISEDISGNCRRAAHSFGGKVARGSAVKLETSGSCLMCIVVFEPRDTAGSLLRAKAQIN